MKLSILSLFAILSLFLLVFGASNVSAQSGKLFTVNDVADTHDATIGDTFCADATGKCTLRAAIEEANATTAQDAVNFALPIPSTIDLTIDELLISTNIYIVGPGARKLTVQRSQSSGTPQFRIFRVQPAAFGFQPTTIRGMTIKNGNANGDGGAIYTESQSSLQLNDVWITNNTAAGSAGAIFSNGTLTVSRSLISSNTSNGLYGGGIVNISLQGTSLITNSTLTNNTGGQGGAIYNSRNLILVNNTISRNSARNSGSSITNDSAGTINVLNTIIGLDNSAAVSSLQGAFVSGGNNLITDARNSSGFTNGTNGDQVSDNNAINPLLGNLADNGGQTNTIALLTGSPAIDHGNNCVLNFNCPAPFTNVLMSTDQRETAYRQSNSVIDVGAFEYNAFNIGSSFGGIGLNLGRSGRVGGAIAVITRAATNEKNYRIVPQNGILRFPTNGRDVYILEIRAKRAGASSLNVIDLEGGIIFNLPFKQTSEKDHIKITYEENSPKKS
jgi:CSLREA domain-containing protein